MCKFCVTLRQECAQNVQEMAKRGSGKGKGDLGLPLDSTWHAARSSLAVTVSQSHRDGLATVGFPRPKARLVPFLRQFPGGKLERAVVLRH